MADQKREEEAVRAVADRLRDTFHTTRSAAQVEEAVTRAHASFDGRPVREFVPVLVERKARALLNEASSEKEHYAP
ncbi:three-helix bundle dimerization domain-containing protein [Streptomyces sp. YIM S03343]